MTLSTAVPPCLVLMGPTASGKTDLALWLADRLPVAIVSVDSAMVYRGMDVGTAKPAPELLRRHPHGLVDVVEPTEAFGAGRFVDEACRLVAEARAGGRLPLLVGGTMLYFHALLRGLDPLPASVPALRREIEARARRLGWPALHEELARLDPPTASRLAPGDGQRIGRALEVCRITGRAYSAQIGRAVPALPGPVVPVALVPGDRQAQARDIETRFDAMLEAGLVAELAGLRRRHPALHGELPAMRCVGYRQVWQYLEGEVDAAEMRRQAVAATRQLARRQRSWLKRFPEAGLLDPAAADTPDRLVRLVEGAA